uniref:C3H1-type domain-containing protein n=1 Tax=Stomoxys calcitrans TaxID=35570 RepID=A0A1I8Q776_STOCA
MESLQWVEDDLKSDSPPLQRRHLRRTRSSSVFQTSTNTISTNDIENKASRNARTRSISVLERRNTVHIFNPSEERQQAPAILGNTVIHDRSFMAAFRSSRDNEPNVDIHLLYGSSSSVINAINLSKEKTMDPKKTPSSKKRKSKVDALEAPPQKTEAIEQPTSEVPHSSSKADTKNPNKPINPKQKKPTKRGEPQKRRVQGRTVKKNINKNKMAPPTQTEDKLQPIEKEDKILEPCCSLVENNKCTRQLSCPFLHSEFPCKYYYLGMQCPKAVNCQFMHNGILPDNIKNALQNHILDLLENPENTEIIFLQKAQEIQNIGECLRNFQEKLRNISTPKKSTKHNDDELEIEHKSLNNAPQQLQIIETNSEMVIDSKETNTTSENFILEDTDEMLQEHDMSNIVASDKVEPQNENMTSPPTIISEIINLDDDNEDDEEDEYVCRLVIDESSNEKKANNNSEEKVTSPPLQNEVVESGCEFEDRNKILSSVEASLQELKNNITLPNMEKASKLVEIFEKLTEQEQLIKRDLQLHDNSPNETPCPDLEISVNADVELRSTNVEEHYKILKESRDVCKESLQKLQSNTTPRGKNRYTELKVILDQLNQQEELVRKAGHAEEEMHSVSPAAHLCEVVVRDANLNDECILLDDELAEVYIHNDAALPRETSKYLRTIDDTNISGLNKCSNNREENIISLDKNISKDCSINAEAIEVPCSEKVEVVSIEILPPEMLLQKTDEEFVDRQMKDNMLKPIAPNDTAIVTDDSGVLDDQDEHENECLLRLELSPEDNEVIEDTNTFSKTTEPEEESPLYEILENASPAPKKTNKGRARLRSDNVQQTESSGGQESDTSSGATKSFKLRRLKLSELKQKKYRNVDDTQMTDKVNFGEHCELAKASCQSTEKTDSKPDNTVVETSLQESVESLMSVMYGEDGDTEDYTTAEMNKNTIPPIKNTRDKIQKTQVAAGLPKARRLNTKNITITKSQRRKVSFDTPCMSVLTSDNSKAATNKLQNRRGPYVALAKLKPHLLESLHQHMQGNDAGTSFTAITTTCNTTNTCKNTTTVTSTTTSVGVLAKKRLFTNSSNDGEDEGKDSDNETSVQLKLEKLVSLDNADQNDKDRDNLEGTSVIRFRKNMMIKDLSKTDCYSSGDEKEQSVTLPTSVSSAATKAKQLKLNQVKEVKEEIDEDILGDLEHRIEEKGHKQRHESHNDIEQNENMNSIIVRPSTTTESSRRLSTRRRHKSPDDVFNDFQENISGRRGSTDRTIIQYGSDEECSNRRISNKNTFFKNSSVIINTKSGSRIIRPHTDWDYPRQDITPISSPTHADSIASPSPGKGGGNMVMPYDYHLEEIDARLTVYMATRPYVLWEIDLSGLTVNRPNNIDKLKKATTLDPRIFGRDVKPLQYQRSVSVPHSSHMTIYPNDPRTRVQQSLSYENAVVSYSGINTQTSSAFGISSQIMGTVDRFIPSSPMNVPQVAQRSTSMILYEIIQNSTWFLSLPSSTQIQVNQTMTQLIMALNNFHRERLLNPGAVFDIFKLDNVVELLSNMNNLGICVDMYGNVVKKQTGPVAQAAPVPMPSYTAAAAAPMPSYAAVHSCSTSAGCNAAYNNFLQQVLTPTTSNCPSVARVGCSGSDRFVSCYVSPPKVIDGTTCCAHKHQTQEHMPASQPMEKSMPDNNYNNQQNDNNNNNYNSNDSFNNNNRRGGNFNNKFRKPYNQDQSQTSYNPRFSKPSSQSPSRASSPQPQSYSPRRGGGGGGFGGRGRGRGGGRFNNFRSQNNDEGGSSWSSSSPRKSFNRNNNFNRNSNYDNNNSSNSYGLDNNTAVAKSPPPAPRTPPPFSSPNRANQLGSSPILSSPAKRQVHASTDEENWD